MFKGHSENVIAVAVLNDPSENLCKSGLCIISGSVDYTVRIWDAAEGTCLFVNTFNSFVECIDISPVASSEMKHCIIEEPSIARSSSCRKYFFCVSVGLHVGAIRVLYI